MISILRDNPLLLLFVIAAIGWPLGRIKVGGVRLGVAAVLFTGLAIGAVSPDLRLPEIVYLLGLVVFVYTVGLNSGSNFLASLKRKGLRDNLFVIALLVTATGLSLVAYAVFSLQPAEAAGLFAGSLTNTPALAGAVEFIQVNSPPHLVDALLAEPVVAYSITYPMGVLGMILAIYLAQRLWKIDYRAEARKAGTARSGGILLDNRTVRITKRRATLGNIAQLTRKQGWSVVFGRIQHGAEVNLAKQRARFQLGDLVTVVGSSTELDRVTEFLGETSQVPLDLDRRELDYQRVFVSNPNVAGHTLRSLNLPQQFGAVITRVRRGDIQLVPYGDTVLELGDRVRVLTKKDHLAAVTSFLGDSYRAVSEIDVLTLSLGLALGILLGLLPIPLPGGLTLKLGMAGGPLLVALAFGALGRTGPFLWNIPFGTNLTLRQFGLILFLAGIGSRSGYIFVATLSQGSGLALFVSGLIITLAIAFGMLWVGYFILKIPMGLLTGMLAGLQTQPALLSFASEQSGDDFPNVGYASVYPVATITKIVLAQVILVWLLS
ncbi:MAG: aspartate:alanine exchanger family transporter [Anaerolineales bacterium]